MRPEVDRPRSDVPAFVPVVLIGCVVVLIGLAFGQLEQRGQRDRRISELEHDLAAERDRTAAIARHIVPRPIAQSTNVTLSKACGIPNTVVNPGMAVINFDSGCRVDFETVCRP